MPNEGTLTPTWDDTTPTWDDTEPIQGAPLTSPLPMDPYQRARLEGQIPARMGSLTPDAPEDLLALPEVLQIPPAIAGNALAAGMQLVRPSTWLPPELQSVPLGRTPEEEAERRAITAEKPLYVPRGTVMQPGGNEMQRLASRWSSPAALVTLPAGLNPAAALAFAPAMIPGMAEMVLQTAKGEGTEQEKRDRITDLVSQALLIGKGTTRGRTFPRMTTALKPTVSPGMEFSGEKATAPWPRALVSRQPSGEGWRLTWFSEFGDEPVPTPVGHKDFVTRSEAINHAKSLDFEPVIRDERVAEPLPQAEPPEVSKPAEPVPPAEPAAPATDRIVAAAFRKGDQVFDARTEGGITHMEADMAARNAGVSVTEADAGFITESGRFLTREQAYEHAKGSRQIQEDLDTFEPGKLHTGKMPSTEAAPTLPAVSAPEQKPTPASIALEEQTAAGWDTKWPFVPADFINKTFRDAIETDPSISAAQKDRMFSAAEKILGTKLPRTETVPSEASAGVKALAVGEVETPEPTTRSTPPPAKAEKGARETAASQLKEEAKKVQDYAAGMVQSASTFIRRSIDSGKSAKDAGLEWAREIGIGLQDTPDSIYNKERGGLYTSTYIKGVLTSREGVALDAKEYLKAVDAGRQEGIAWKNRVLEKQRTLGKTSEPIAEQAAPTEKSATPATPEAASAKVEDQVKQAATTEGLRAAKEIKSDIVSNIEAAIEKAPNESIDENLASVQAKPRMGRKLGPKQTTTVGEVRKNPRAWEVASFAIENAISAYKAVERERYGKITIEIPGDGTFTVFNTKEALGTLLERAKKISTSTKPPKGYTESKPSREEGKKWMEEARQEPPPTTRESSLERELKDAEEFTGKAATVAERATVEWATHVEDVVKPLKAKIRQAESSLNEMVYDANRTKPETKRKNKLTKKAFYEKYGVATAEEANALYAKKAAELTDLEKQLAEAELKTQELQSAKEKRGKEWSSAATRSGKLRRQLYPKVKEGDVGQQPPLGPGAQTVGELGKPQIEQLTDAFKGIEATKPTTNERVQAAFRLGERLTTARDAFSKALSGLRSAGDFIIAKWKGIPAIDDLLRAKGELSAAIEERGWHTRAFLNQASKAIPRPQDQAAISKWIDAGGDRAKLERGLQEAPTQFKQAYQDALDLQGDLLIAAQNAQNYFEARLQEAIDAGVLKQGVEDYIHRIYESRPNVRDKAIAYVQTGLLKPNPALARRRVFEFDWEAEKLGFKPVQSFIQRIAAYESSLAKAIASREFIRKAIEMRADDGRPVIDIKGEGIPVTDEVTGERQATLIKPAFNPSKNAQQYLPDGSLNPNYRGDYVNKEFPVLSRWKWVSSDAAGKPIFVQGDVAIHPKYAGRITALLEPSRVRYGKYGHIFRPALKASAAFKQTMLDLSGFHQVQITAHGLEHKVLPWRITQDIDFTNPNVQGLLKGGVTLGGDTPVMQAEGLIGSSLTRKVPFLGPLMESYHQWLFQSYIPRIKMTMAMAALERNRKRYAGQLTDEQIFYKTAQQANSAFGELNYTMLERSKTAQDISRMIFLAPDFLEARTRFAAEAFAKGGKSTVPGFGNEQRAALLLGAMTLYITARIANKILNDQYHFEPENAFSVVHNGRAFSLRTVQGDILHLLEHPVQFWMNRLNPVFGRTTLELATGRDYFGRKVNPLEALWDNVKNIMPISLRHGRERKLWESMLNSFGFTARRWSDVDDAFTLAKKWKDANGIGEKGEFIYDRDKDPLRPLKLALNYGTEQAAAAEIKKLSDAGFKRQKLNEYFRRYGSMPFTGSLANDRKWKQTLSEDERKTVESARAHKTRIKNKFFESQRMYDAAVASQPQP